MMASFRGTYELFFGGWPRLAIDRPREKYQKTVKKGLEDRAGLGSRSLWWSTPTENTDHGKARAVQRIQLSVISFQPTRLDERCDGVSKAG
jgi:hypothetical protein